MDINTINLLVRSKNTFLQLYDSGFVFGLKIILAIYVAVLIADIILIIMLATPGKYYRVMKAGADVPVAKKSGTQKRWDKLKARLRTGKESQYKAAVLEADEIVGEILVRIGYPGKNTGERLESIRAEQLETIEELKKAHEARNAIVRQPGFPLDRKKAEELVEAYQKTLETLEFL